MPSVRVALAQVNPTVGDLVGNAALVRSAVAEAAAREARLVLLPEMVRSTNSACLSMHP